MPRYPNWSREIHVSEIGDDTNILPTTQGVYKLYYISTTTEKLQYVGEAEGLKRRIAYNHHGWAWWNYCRYTETIGYRKSKRKDLERKIIEREQPPYNDHHTGY